MGVDEVISSIKVIIYTIISSKFFQNHFQREIRWFVFIEVIFSKAIFLKQRSAFSHKNENPLFKTNLIRSIRVLVFNK